MSKNLPPEGTYRTKGEEEAKKKYAEIFENSSEETQIKLQNFTKYIRRQDATRFLSCFELLRMFWMLKVLSLNVVSTADLL